MKSKTPKVTDVARATRTATTNPDGTLTPPPAPPRSAPDTTPIGPKAQDMPVTLADADAGFLHEVGARMCAAFEDIALRASQIAGDAEDLAKLMLRLGAEKSFPAYTAVRAAWIDGARVKIVGDTRIERAQSAIDRAWVRAYDEARACKAGETLPKGGPKSTTPEAVRQQASRSAKAEKFEALKASGTPAELKARALKALQAGDDAASRELLDAAKSKQGDLDARAREAVKDKLDAAAKRVREALTRMLKSADLKGVEALAAAAVKLSPEPKHAA